MGNLTTEETKFLLYDLVEQSDAKLVELLYAVGLQYSYIHYEPSVEFLAELEKRQQAYINGDMKTHTREEVKKRLVKSLTGKSSKKNELYRIVRDASEATVEKLLTVAGTA